MLADGTRGVVNNHLYYLGERDFVAKNPKVIEALFEDSVEQGIWLKKNLRQAAELIAPLQGLPVDVVELALRRYEFNVKPITPSGGRRPAKDRRHLLRAEADPQAHQGQRRGRAGAALTHGSITMTFHSPKRRRDPGRCRRHCVAFVRRVAQMPARQFRIGHQKGALSMLKGRGTLEKRLAPLRVTVKWTEFTAGPVQLEGAQRRLDRLRRCR